MSFIDTSEFVNLLHWLKRLFFKAQPITTISLGAGEWTIGPIVNGVNDSHNMPLNPSPSGAGWTFDFPSADGVHYVTIATDGKLTPGATLTATFTITGTGTLVASPGGGTSAPKARLYFQRSGDDWATNGYRWWSAPSTLEPGTHTLSFPLTFANWTSIYGQTGITDADFQAALADVQAIGITFGADFAGHGLYAQTPPVSFKMESYAVK